MRVIGRVWMVLACVLVLAACGSEDTPDPADTPATPAAATPPPESGMQVGPIVWAQVINEETGEPTDVVTGFTIESPAIIAAIEVDDMPAGTEFTASWTINDQPIEGFDMDITASEDLEHSWISFSFTRDDGQRYPLGQLTVVITSSEGDLRESSVEIGFP